MGVIEGLRIYAVELAHAPGKIAFDRFDYDVVMIAHQAPRMTNPIETLAGFGEQRQPS